ncbi:DUF4355 domain-containing protein [Pontibacillus litoralis]|uniref:Scaffold protein n=1 Tax=Pontibacillus litoralis JSM 072002 TaxID=1385512 RepID=A0A0A5HWN3_9BACI|nr:DUF4355 domain-containing protein [Pontibacillus litoralis]KGX88007.1 scaffold protein [Pontibacillus litoralis JSM 072002]
MLKTIKPLKLNLQHFAEGDPDPIEPLVDPKGDPGKETFTQSEVDSKISKAVESALKKQQEKFEKQKQDEINKAKQDAAEYAKMTAQEKQQADYEKRMKQLEQRERELNQKQLHSEIVTDLKEDGLPTEFAESLIHLGDNEKIKDSISNIKKVFDEAVNNAVKEKLRQDPPERSQSFKGHKKSGHNSRADMAKQARII